MIRSGYNALLLDAAIPDELATHLLAQAGCSAVIMPHMHALYAQAPDIASDSFTDDTGFTEKLGSDSLQVLSLALKAEECFDMPIPPEVYGRCVSVKGICELIRELQSGACGAGGRAYAHHPL